jgi:hypothetical protein
VFSPISFLGRLNTQVFYVLKNDIWFAKNTISFF